MYDAVREASTRGKEVCVCVCRKESKPLRILPLYVKARLNKTALSSVTNCISRRGLRLTSLRNR